VDAERRSRLLGVTLRAVVAEHVGAAAPVGDPQGFAPGAALRHAADAWVLLDQEPARRLGSALAWALRSGAERLHVVASAATGVLARRAAEFAYPIDVWQLDGRALRPAEAEALASPPAPRPEHVALAGLVEEAGAAVVIEHGVVRGEVRGLEVCRVVEDAATGAIRLEVGVGPHDREAFALMYGDVPVIDALRGVVDAVTLHRVPGTAQHPLTRLAPERLLRWRLEQDPSPVGASELFPAEPPLPREGLKQVVACSATGTSLDGAPLLVVCSSGVDLDVVPYAADARLAVRGAPGVGRGGPRTVLAMPSRDVVPLTVEMAGLLRERVELVGVDER
jgi:hypothetical protein